MIEESDYIFRYPIEENAKEDERDPLLGMMRIQLQSLLKLLSLYHEGEEVKADGFRLINEWETIHPIFPLAEEDFEPQPHPSA
ncbi:MAG: hypothetical protein QME78_05080, partial [Thermodesulfobacteriota bacterium]|nr:hypothetical protein [Thermodesulfobacteriota bacterium]